MGRSGGNPSLRRVARVRRRRLVAAAVIVVALAAVAMAVRAAVRVDTHGVRVTHFTITSRYAHRALRATLAVPSGSTPGGRPRGLLVFLHGRGGDGEDSNANSAFFAALARLGSHAPVVVFPNGGDHGYWHDRRGARWGAYVMREVIPQGLRRGHADPRRVAIGGISMGGFGALDLARLHPGRFCAAGAHSPALWRTGGETAPGAFDDAADFARHDVVGGAQRTPGVFSRQPLWLDAGTADPFDPGDRAFAAALRSASVPIAVHRSAGGHDGSYWHRHYDEYLRFYAAALARCRV